MDCEPLAGRADRLTERFQDALARLEHNPFIAPIAPESEDVGQEVRHITFRTRSGRTFRASAIVDGGRRSMPCK